MHDPIVYIGSYTRTEPHVQGTSQGIESCRFDGASGALHKFAVAGGVVNPSFVTVDRAGHYLYAVQEIEQFGSHSGGAVSAFRIDPDGHTLELVNHQPTHGNHPCYISVDASGRWLLVANYGGGSVSVLPIGSDGAIGAATAVVQHDGPHPHHDGPHPHSIMAAPGDNGFVVVPDCGLDRVYVYRLDTETGALTPHETPWIATEPGSGPRHAVFNAAGTRLYCINERNSSLTVFGYDAQEGTLHTIHTLSTLPDDFTGRNSCADIHIDPAGRFVYGSNRGHNSIAIFAVNETSGELHAVGHASTEGRTPRNFAIDPTGDWLLAANQDSNTIVPFRIDKTTGALRRDGPLNESPSPVCVCFLA